MDSLVLHTLKSVFSKVKLASPSRSHILLSIAARKLGELLFLESNYISKDIFNIKYHYDFNWS